MKRQRHQPWIAKALQFASQERERMIEERDALLLGRTEQIAERDALLAQRAEQIAVLNQELDYRASLTWWIKSPWRIIKRTIKGNP